jgi:hypothetical protein
MLKIKNRAPLQYMACLEEDAIPHYFKSQRQAGQWLLERGKGQIKKREVIELAFPLEKKIAKEVWIKISA